MRGGQWQVLHLACALRERGVEQRLLCAGPLLEEARSRGLDAEPMSALAMARQSRWADLVHAHDARSHTLAALIPGPPVVVSRRVTFAVRPDAASKWKYGRAARFLAVSSFVAKVLEDGGVPSEIIDVVPDGVPVPESIVPFSGRDPRRLVAVATADPRKGAGLLVQAAEHARVDVHFSHALWDDLPTAGLFVYLTYAEGLGSAALLAMAHGVPVIASQVGGVPEAVLHEATGLLTANDPFAVATAIERVLEDRALASRLSMAGRESVSATFSISRLADRTLDSYRKVISSC